jgi:hypothetical protein
MFTRSLDSSIAAAQPSRLQPVLRTLVLAAGLCGGAAMAVPLSIVGSSGTVDDNDVSEVSLTGGAAFMYSTAPIGSAHVIYNVPALAKFSGNNKTATLRVRFNDAGADEQVIVALKQYATTGTTTTLATFDSNIFASSALNQTQQICFNVDSWDFINGPFYLDVTLAKTGVSGTPGLANMVLVPDSCAP